MIRSSGIADTRRSLRLWAALALAAGTLTTVQWIDQPGPGKLLAGLVSLAGLWIVLRHSRPRGTGVTRADMLNLAGLLALFAGLALFLLALAVSHGGEQRTQIAALCEGQSAQMGDWKLKLTRTTPVAGEGFTALEAAFSVSRSNAMPLLLEPQLRAEFGDKPPADRASRAHLWNGTFTLAFTSFDPRTGCLALNAVWRPFAGWTWIGSWLAGMGSLAMGQAALGSIRWRLAARKRIAMRRTERPLPSARTLAKARHIRPIGGLLLTLCLAGWLALGSPATLIRPAQDAAPAFAGGTALVKARQSLLEGPANTNRWIVIGDAMARRGQFASAAEVLLGAVEADPRDVDGWLALGDALYGHAGGHMTPAARLAYDRADRAAALRGMSEPVARTMERSGRGELAAAWRSRQAAR